MDQSKIEQSSSSMIDVPKMIAEDRLQDDDSTSYTANAGNESFSGSDEEAIGAAESRKVQISRMIMFCVFAIAACGFALLTFFYASGQEQGDFESSFESLAKELIKVSQLSVNRNFEALESLSQTITSYSVGVNATWPYVTHPNFGAISETVMENIQGRFVAFIPFVEEREREQWEAYSVENQGFIQDAKDYSGLDFETLDIVPFIYRLGLKGFEPNASAPIVYDTEPINEKFPFHSPLWQLTPITPGPQQSNFQAWQDPVISQTIKAVFRREESVMSQAFIGLSDTDETRPWPEAYYMSPIFEDFSEDADVVGVVNTFGDLRLFDSVLSDQGLDGIVAVVSNLCSEPFTWRINGPESVFVGVGELVEPDFLKYGIVERATALLTTNICPVTIAIYPSQEFQDKFTSTDPAIFTAATALIFVITALFFVLYDRLVEKRQGKVMSTAKQSGAIVDSLFPAGIRERLMENQENRNNLPGGREGHKRKKLGLDIFASKPIADYYPEATVMVADIANFSAWSSVREPSQVFSLLETLYNSFDLVAKKRRIFKVDSIADCYVACCNVPDPRKDHAVAMARFAKDCRMKMNEVVQKLEVWLGPDTSDLRMRFAMNTGPVTAGVLRGDKARFQLFGITMDLCYRLEGSGESDEIHIAESTANSIKAAGLESWLTPRKEKVLLKGRGETQTYWLDYGDTRRSTLVSDCLDGSAEMSTGSRVKKPIGAQAERLIDWNVDVLSRLLKEIMAMQTVSAFERNLNREALLPTSLGRRGSHTVLDEVQEIIKVRTHDTAGYQMDPDAIELDLVVVEQLKSYVVTVASLYRPNPFHNFEHACHVTQAVTKMLSRVVTPTKIDTNTMTYTQDKEAHELHKFTYGITSDPLIQFSCALSALIHDVDHPGVPNSQLVKEGTRHAAVYNNQSVAEQNSVDLAWDLLMEPQFQDLRDCIYTDQEELDRFRQLVVNSVMATDIVDKELGAARKNRWNKAFSAQEEAEIKEEQKIQRKATIVIEHLVQAADVSHMMQHWHIYIKWNEKFFRECYRAYLAGRAEKDPSEGWYKGELGFYQFYVIPLAKKLETCGVFGVSSDEFLNYADANHREWELKGEEMVAKYIANFNRDQEKEKNVRFSQ